MASKAKFLFDMPFDGSRPKVERSYAPKPPPPKFSAEDIEAAKLAAYNEGEAAGRAAAYAEHQQNLEQALAMIGTRMAEIASLEQRAITAARTEAVELTVALTRKLAGRLIEREPLDQIEALVLRCMNDLRDEPRLVVRAAESVIQQLDPHVDMLVSQSGFGGKLVLVPDETIAPSDCRVDWADGSAERRQADLEAAVEAAVERYLAGLHADLAAPQQ